jgi:hypothetical protein
LFAQSNCTVLLRVYGALKDCKGHFHIRYIP